MNITRRDFVGSFIATMAIPTIGQPKDDQFEDIRVDRYYDLQGGQYGDTGGIGRPGYQWGPYLVEELKCLKQCRVFEERLEIVEKNGCYFTPSSYLREEFCTYDRIYLTKDWMMEFYRRHKDDTFDMWKSRYDEYLSNLD